jgi:FkbH-like protein
MYHEQRKRNRDRSEYSYEDWLASLQLQLTLWEAKERDYDRIVELSLRTHQFNVANTRLSKNTVHKLVEPDHRKIIVGSCGDRFGDFGRVVFVIVAAEEDAFWNIEGFCLSCRVMNRGIETACLAYIARKVREAGTKELRGIVYPTPKNVPGQALYRDHGFEEFSSQNNEIETWKLNLTKNQLQVPNWVELKVSR